MLESLLETLNQAIAAYKARIQELEATVANQQKIIEELRSPPTPPPGEAK